MRLFTPYTQRSSQARRVRNEFVALDRRIARADRRVTQARTELSNTQARFAQARINLALSYAGLIASVLSLAYILA